MDYVHQIVTVASLERPINLTPHLNKKNSQSAEDIIVNRLKAAKSPVLIIDALTARFGASKMAQDFAEILRCPTFATPMGKSIIAETKPYFLGIYNGQISYDGVAQVIEDESDLVIEIGPLLSDSNTGGHSRKVLESKLLSIYPSFVTVAGTVYEDVPILQCLSQLVQRLREIDLPTYKQPKIALPAKLADSEPNNIEQSWIWGRLGKCLQAGDTIVVDSGTAQFGFPDAELAAEVGYITQLYYGSIGYSVPACFGAAIARKELNATGRLVLLVGDGSLQLTVQEIGTMIRYKLDIIIFVINNSGYTIERAIHGPEEVYNDISAWDHSHMLSFFGLKDGQKQSYQARTKRELNEILDSHALKSPQSITMVEIFMDKMDIPWRLAGQIALIRERQKPKEA